MWTGARMKSSAAPWSRAPSVTPPGAAIRGTADNGVVIGPGSRAPYIHGMTEFPHLARRAMVAFAMVIGLGFALPGVAFAGSEINKSFFSGVAIDDADAVAYFTEGRAVEGSPAFTHDWKGAEWRFASAANRDAFAADPERYAPQFGGYCAWAVSQGSTASIDREAWSVVDGKLYLNYSASVRDRWSQNVAGNIAKAEANWPGVIDD